jgi:hypothetical protein
LVSSRITPTVILAVRVQPCTRTALDLHSESPADVLSRQLDLAEDAAQETWTDGFSGMNGDDGGSAIGMAEEVMTSLDPESFKPQAS